jgi:hypothetical protein
MNTDYKCYPSEDYKYVATYIYVIGLKKREEIIYFRTEEEALDFVANGESRMRKYLGNLNALFTS